MTIEVVIKVIVTGSTGWTDASTLENELTLLKNEYPELLVIHGNEPGAESLVENVCSAPGITTITVTANFAEYQDLAITKRNEEMIRIYDPHMLYCFADYVDKDPFLIDFLKKAQERAVITKVIRAPL